MNCLSRIIQTRFVSYTLLTIGIIFFAAMRSSAQDYASLKFGKVKVEDFAVRSPVVDSGSNAVIVYDKGDISFEGNKYGWFSYVFKRSTRIMLFNRQGFDLATVQILLYKNDDALQKVVHVNGSTYRIENNKVVENKLNEKDVFEEKYDKTHVVKKFTMPGVSEGCIIEYTYTVKSDYIFNLPSWKFQSVACPTLWSEYNVAIPGLLSYMSVFQGSQNFAVNENGSGTGMYTITQQDRNGPYNGRAEQRYTVSSPLTKHTWAKKDMPAFSTESYISSPENFVDKISFQLFKTYDGETSHDVAKDWKTVADKLLKQDDFGKSFDEENYWLDDVLVKVVAPNDDILQKAKKIYHYVQDNYACNNRNEIFITTSVQDVVKKKGGSVGDINLLLIALLRHANINAMPVVLSTTAHGHTSTTYPFLDQLDYVVGAVNINSTDYFLDATVPFLPFGKLPLDCYNGHARIISGDAPAVYFNSDQVKESETTNVFILNNGTTEVEGVFNRKMGFFKSLDTKTSIAKSSLNSYMENLKKSYPDALAVSNIKVDSFLLPETLVSEKFDFKLSDFENNDVVYFNPMMGEAVQKNPFYAADRILPVEMPYTTDEIYTLHMEIPNGFKVEELPKSMKSTLNQNDGYFEYLISADANIVQLKCKLTFNKTYFAPEDYQTLRDFYAAVVKKQSEQIVFKKIK